MSANELKEEIIDRRDRRLRRETTAYPRNNPTASGLSECAREMALSILFWQQVPTFDPFVKARLEEGQRQENYVLQELLQLGFTITENNPPPWEIKDRRGRLIMRGKIDGKIEWKGKKVPFEVKSLDPNVFNRVDKLDDFYKFFWMKKYILQVMSYLYVNNEDEGIFIMVDMKGHWKIIEIKLDLEIMEGILQLCEKVVDSIERSREIINRMPQGLPVPEYLNKIGITLPPFHNNFSVCRRCKIFGTLCFPDLSFGEGTKVLDDIDLEEKLKRRDELQRYTKEYELLDKEIKARVEKIPAALCGDFSITGEEKIRNFKAQPAKDAYATSYWQTKIEKIKGATNDEQESA